MKTLITILVLFLSSTCFGQDYSSENIDFIKNNSLQININEDFSDEVYEKIKGYDLIMIGERHGTIEPSQLTEKLVKLFSIKNKKVYLGLEIPKNQMPDKSERLNDSTLFKSKFFSKPNRDGRNSYAWYNLIKNTYLIPNLEFFFFDNFILMVDDFRPELRDSSFYKEIKALRLSDPDAVIIILTGSLHNKLKKVSFQKTAGSFIYNDDSFDKNKILSISHIFGKGTLMNNKGNGLELSEYDFSDNIYSNSLESEQYLLFNVNINEKGYNCYFYTRYVTHSKSLKTKGNK